MPRRARPLALVPPDFHAALARRAAMTGDILDDIFNLPTEGETEKPPISGEAPPLGPNPGPVPFRPGHWRHTPSPPLYVFAQGETLYGLAKTYAGDGQAWLTQLRPLQTRSETEPSPISGGRYVNKDTTKFFPTSKAPGRFIQPGDVLIMPASWAERAKQLESQGEGAPSDPGTPGWRSGDDSSGSWLDRETLGVKNKWLLLGGAVLGGLYAATS